jgi:ketosteroid isomerase-like protein
MSQENVELVRRAIGAWNRRDLKAWLDLFHPEAELDWSRSHGPLQAVYRGHAGIQSFSDEFWTTFETFQIEAHEFVDGGSEIVVPNTAHARARQDVEVVAKTTIVFTLENGQITCFRMFQERGEALKAVGLSGQDAHADS